MNQDPRPKQNVLVSFEARRRPVLLRALAWLLYPVALLMDWLAGKARK